MSLLLTALFTLAVLASVKDDNVRLKKTNQALLTALRSLTSAEELAVARDDQHLHEGNQALTKALEAAQAEREISVSEGGKIGVVDVQAVYMQLSERDQVDKKLSSEFAQRVGDLSGMGRHISGSRSEIAQRDPALMSSSEKTQMIRKLESLESLEKELNVKGAALDADRLRRRNEEQQRLMVEIQQAINVIAEQENYDMVLVKRKAVIYVKPASDITNKVKKALTAETAVAVENPKAIASVPHQN